MTFCFISVDYCKNSPCQNGGTCENLVDRRECTCPDGFRGDSCQDGMNKVSFSLDNLENFLITLHEKRNFSERLKTVLQVVASVGTKCYISMY